MENSPKLESMPTLCRSANLPAETTISKWRVMVTIRQLLQLPTEGTSAFGGFRATASPPPHPPATSGTHRYSGVTSCHYMGMNAWSGRSLLNSHRQGNDAQVMLLTNPLACPETGQKHFRGRDQQPATGCDTEQQLSAPGRGCMSVVIVGNTGNEGAHKQSCNFRFLHV